MDNAKLLEGWTTVEEFVVVEEEMKFRCCTFTFTKWYAKL